jgi:uncharacterized protein (TIGR00297 family)
MTTHSESARQWVHIGSVGFALLLRALTWPQAALLAIVALVFNALALPRIGGRTLYRPEDAARGFPLGILLYPLSVLLLILTLGTRLDLVAAAWGVLAFGDGFATLVGRAVPSARLPWNQEKSVAGSLAFVAFGGAGAIALAWWTRDVVDPPSSTAFLIVAPLVAAIAAALVESIPVRLDDNVSVPATAGAVLWLASLMTSAAWLETRAVVIGTLPWAIGVNAVVAWLGYRAGTVSISGMIGGAVVGIVVFAAGGANAWTLLFLSFLLATVTSRLGLHRKRILRIAEERGGRRGAGNAFANCGVATIASVLAVTTPYPKEALLALTAALTAGGSDTVASEIGKAWGRRTFLVSTLRRVPPGTSGAMSLEGTLAGVAAAFALAEIAAFIGLVGYESVLPVVIAATAGAIVESLLGATLEGPGILNNDMLNFINTAIAASVAIVFA